MDIKRFTNSGLTQRIQALEAMRENIRREVDRALAEEARAQQAAIDKRAVAALLEENLAACYAEVERREEEAVAKALTD
jgi:hypothetical protein